MLTNSILWFVILILAVWRTSSIFTREDGPFNLFGRLRVRVYVLSTLKSRFQPLFSTVNDGLGCMACNSVWFALFYCAFFSENIIQWFVMAMAVSAGAILYERWYNLLRSKDG